MRMYDIILKKRDGHKLGHEEIAFFITEYVAGHIPDYQASAFIMAAFICGLDTEETACLTNAMANSGDVADLSSLGTVADKHSTGGVADTTTLLVAPLVASCGLKVAKMSGRGLGHTGGTLDKLESIPGMTVSLEMDAFIAQIKRVGAAITGQTMRLCPADKMLYSLRDLTATVDSIPLIASSIMSKKIASGAGIIMLDVKTGNGAFMETLEDSKALARTMVDIGNNSGKKTAAIISDMSQPLGCAVGNALEVIEAIEILQGETPGGDLLAVALKLSALMLQMSGIAQNETAAFYMLDEALCTKRALDKLGEIIAAQGGDSRVIRDTSLMPRAQYTGNMTATTSGILSAVDCRGLGLAVQELGAGRAKKEDSIDLSVGFIMKKRIGDRIEKDDILFEIYANDKNKLISVKQKLIGCLKIADSAKKPVLICDSIL
ncbi:MAG: thymidine phosphorylase [Eubacteriales bacterium]|nr:thymidine phosphorylase [Eubacteriales bacterium]